MKNIDKNNRLRSNPFGHQVNKNNTTRITYEGRHIMTLSEKDTLKLVNKLRNADDFQEQLILAKVTGHFKH